MVDAADHEKVEASRNELHNLLDKPQLQGIPVSRPTLQKLLRTHVNEGVSLYDQSADISATQDLNCYAF